MPAVQHHLLVSPGHPCFCWTAGHQRRKQLVRLDTFPAPQTLVSHFRVSLSTPLTPHLAGSLSGEGHPGHCSVLAAAWPPPTQHQCTYPPVVTMTVVPRPSLQKLLPDELMHMVQTDLLHPGLGQVSQRARERGPQKESPCHGHKLPTPTQSSQEQTNTAGAARKGRACCLLGREQSISPSCPT